MENIATTVHALSALEPESALALELGAATLENAAKLSLQREQLEQTNHEYVALAAENHRQILKLLNVVRGSVTAADVSSPNVAPTPRLPSRDKPALGPVLYSSAAYPKLTQPWVGVDLHPGDQ